LAQLTIVAALPVASRRALNGELTLRQGREIRRPYRFCQGAVMVDTFYRYLDKLTHYAGTLERGHWVVLSVAVLVLGLICMRGFGSRDKY
jgi:hypothetical protein